MDADDCLHPAASYPRSIPCRVLSRVGACTALAPSVIEPPPTVTIRSAPASRVISAASITACRGVCGGMWSNRPAMRIDELGVPVLFTEAARFQSWLDVEAALAEPTIIPAEMPDSSRLEQVRNRLPAGGRWIRTFGSRSRNRYRKGQPVSWENELVARIRERIFRGPKVRIHLPSAASLV